MNFTPAPWKSRVILDNKFTEIRGSGEIMEPVCIIPHDDITDESLKEVEGNFNLIYHAPQMYNLLDELAPILAYLEDEYNSAEAAGYKVLVNNLLKLIEGGNDEKP